jgi:drug/metabolite transporter (DMT)-like permease
MYNFMNRNDNKQCLTSPPMFGKITPAHLLLHFIVLIWGWSPILGRAIETQAFQLVWFRMAITIVAVSLYFLIKKESIVTSLKKMGILVGVGAVIAFHWFCFYNAIKVSNVSITLVGFSTGTIFTSFIEPLFYRRRIIPYEIIFGLLIIGAIAMIMYEDLSGARTEKVLESLGESATKINFSLGIFFGVLAAFTSSLFTVWNGLLVRTTTSTVITFYELSGGLLALSVYLLASGGFTNTPASGSGNFFVLPKWDYIFLAILSIVGTAFPFIASTNLLKKISPYTMTLTVNLETVYGIILAAVLFKEYKQLTPLFYIATIIILLVILFNAILKNYLERKKTAAQ